MPVAGSRNLEKEQHWRQLFAEFQTSGLSIAAFCRANKTVPSQFYDWKKRLSERDAEAAPAPAPKKHNRKAARAKAIAAKLRTSDPRAVEFAEVRIREQHAPEPVAQPVALQQKTDLFVLEVVLPSGTQLRCAKNCPADFLEAVLTIVEAR